MYQVLLVDDEVLVREAISENIKWNELGYELVGSCQNGREAIEFLEKNSVDIVLTDICMPYVDGMELSEYIFNNLTNINIIIFSGFDDFEYAKKAIRYNVQEYLLKPVTAFELSEVLTNLKEKMDKKKEEQKKFGKLNETYHKNRLFIKCRLLEDFIKGSRTQENDFSDLLEQNIVLDATDYRVAIVDIDQSPDQTESEDDMKPQSSLMTFAVYNICEEILEQYQAGYACIGSDNQVFIIFKTNKPKTFEYEVKSICKEMCKCIKKYMKLDVTIGIGKYVKYPKDVYKSYEEAEDSLRYQYLYCENSIIDMSEIRIKKNQSREDVLPEQDIDALILAIKMNDKIKIEIILDRLQTTIKSTVTDKIRSDLYLQQIILAISNTCKSTEPVGIEANSLKNQLLSDIAKVKNISIAIDLLKKYCYKASEEMELQKNIGGKKQAVLAMDYIEKNYSDPDLNLNSVCSYLSISASRFSTIFKNITGETFMEALIRIRMQKAKELLEITDYKNYEIAEKVGFSDPHYFSIVFKKMTGKTPSEYAKEKR